MKLSVFICIDNVLKWVPSHVAHMVKNLPAMWETKVQSLSWEDLLEKGMATPLKYLLPGGFHEQRILVRCSLRGHKELDTTERLTHTQFIMVIYKWLMRIPV